MMNPSPFLVASFLAIFGVASLPAQTLEALKGNCTIGVSTRSDKFELLVERGTCPKNPDGSRDNSNRNRDSQDRCYTNENDQPFNAFSGFVESDLGRDGAHIEAVISAEAGTLTCSGSIHNFKLSGDFTFTPNPAFAARMLKLGIQGITSENMQTYALFHIQAANIEALQNAGVTPIEPKDVTSFSIFHVDVPFVQSIRALGYDTPTARKLVELKIHGVDPEEVKQIRALGFQPTLDELVKMRIFKVTPDFIRRMKAAGWDTTKQPLTIAKLVKIRTFKLDE